MDSDNIVDILDFIGGEGSSEIGSLYSSVGNIIQDIRNIDPSFDIKGYLIKALYVLNRMSRLKGSEAYKILIYLKDVLNVYHINISATSDNKVYIGFSSRVPITRQQVMDKLLTTVKYEEYIPLGSQYRPPEYEYWDFEGIINLPGDRVLRDIKFLAKNMDIPTDESSPETVILTFS